YRLHVHQPTAATAWFQLTNSTVGSTSGDGFFFGMSTTGDAFFWNAEGQSRFYASNVERMRLTEGALTPATVLTTTLGTKALKWDALYWRDLHVETLVAEDVISTIQGDIVVTPSTTLTAAITDSQTTIAVEHNEIAVGDRLLLKSVGAEEWMAV